VELVTTEVNLLDLPRKQQEILSSSKIVADLRQHLRIKVSFKSSAGIVGFSSQPTEKEKSARSDSSLFSPSINDSAPPPPLSAASSGSTGPRDSPPQDSHGAEQKGIHNPAILQKTKAQVLQFISPRQVVPSCKPTPAATTASSISLSESKVVIAVRGDTSSVNTVATAVSDPDMRQIADDSAAASKIEARRKEDKKVSSVSPFPLEAFQSPTRLVDRIQASEKKNKNPLAQKMKGKLGSPVHRHEADPMDRPDLSTEYDYYRHSEWKDADNIPHHFDAMV
jgi:hypothetical protein